MRLLGPVAVGRLLDALPLLMPRISDPDMAWNNLERFLAAAPVQLATLLEDNDGALAALLPLLGTSQFFADILAANPDFLEMVRLPLRQSPRPEELRRQLRAAAEAAADDAALLRQFRRFRQQQMLRIGANDVIRERSLEEITHDLSNVADAAL